MNSSEQPEQDKKIDASPKDAGNQTPPSKPDDIPNQAPPPPHIFVVITQLAQDNLEAAFQRIGEDLQALIDHSEIAKKYNFLFLYDEQSPISERTSNRLYAAANSTFGDTNKPTFLLLHTKGGAPVPAYLISRYLKTSSDQGFVASIPRRAKSAGTLIALGAKEIHMGMMSELGPVDPQFSNLPALGLGTALDYIAGICEKHPGSAKMLARYLKSNLNIHHLGLFERVSESTTHYAEKLLTRAGFPPERATQVANQLVYGYKDHSFAIDCDEIKSILGEEIVKIEAAEYKLANQIHEYMEQVNVAYHVIHGRYCSVTGRADGLTLRRWVEE
jgi:hypothetical protein